MLFELPVLLEGGESLQALFMTPCRGVPYCLRKGNDLSYSAYKTAFGGKILSRIPHERGFAPSSTKTNEILLSL